MDRLEFSSRTKPWTAGDKQGAETAVGRTQRTGEMTEVVQMDADEEQKRKCSKKLETIFLMTLCKNRTGNCKAMIERSYLGPPLPPESLGKLNSLKKEQH